MGREILFRGKTINSGKWIESMTISKGAIHRKINNLFLEIGENRWEGIIPGTLGQFTGLLDKNGAKIFEGDIVSGGMIMCNQGYSIKNDKSTVSFIDGMFKCGSLSLITFARKCEVVGNIHDNPELLKSE